MCSLHARRVDTTFTSLFPFPSLPSLPSLYYHHQHRHQHQHQDQTHHHQHQQQQQQQQHLPKKKVFTACQVGAVGLHQSPSPPPSPPAPPLPLLPQLWALPGLNGKLRWTSTASSRSLWGLPKLHCKLAIAGGPASSEGNDPVKGLIQWRADPVAVLSKLWCLLRLRLEVLGACQAKLLSCSSSPTAAKTNIQFAIAVGPAGPQLQARDRRLVGTQNTQARTQNTVRNQTHLCGNHKHPPGNPKHHSGEKKHGNHKHHSGNWIHPTPRITPTVRDKMGWFQV